MTAPITSIEPSAKEFAERMHEGQLYSGCPYFSHCAQVHDILKQVTDDANLLAAAYLHDVVEDCGVTEEELKEKFGEDVAGLVMEVTHEGRKDNVGYYFPRLKSRRGIMLKMADRLSNIANSWVWAEDRQAQYLRKSVFWKTGPVA